MAISQLSLTDFRNLKSTTLDLDRRPVIQDPPVKTVYCARQGRISVIWSIRGLQGRGSSA
jgi:hypothetical protein